MIKYTKRNFIILRKNNITPLKAESAVNIHHVGIQYIFFLISKIIKSLIN